MTEEKKREMVLALMGPMHLGTGSEVLDRIAREIEEILVADVELIEPIVYGMIQQERAERFRMLLEICAARCLVEKPVEIKEKE